jgi:translocator protein
LRVCTGLAARACGLWLGLQPLISQVRSLAMLLSRHSTTFQALGLLAWLALVFVAAALGAIASADAPAFYGQLAKPGWAPPASVFGLVWSLLYGLMAVAAWLVWRDKGAAGRTTALGLFIAQLGANALWSWLFFGWRQGALAFADVLLLLVLVVATAAAFWRIRRAAGLLLLPYVAWVGFASALTWAVWQGNPELL